MAAEGTLTAGAPLPLSMAANDQIEPAIDWDGEDDLVVWLDDRNGAGWDIYGALTARSSTFRRSSSGRRPSPVSSAAR